MSRTHKFIIIALLAIGATVLGRLFLNAPIAHIQFAGETVGHDIFGKWNITNSIVAAWLAMGIIISVSLLATRKMQMVPSGLQNFVEAVISWLLGLAESIAGSRKNGRMFFPLAATLFIFIVVANWTSLIPIFGNIGNIEPAGKFLEHQVHDVVEDLNSNLPDAAQFPDHYGHGERPPETVVQALLSEAGEDKLAIFNGDGAFATIPIGFGIAKEITLAEYWDFQSWEPRHGEVVSGETTVNLEGKTVGILVPWLRSMNTDLMNPLAMALVAMFMVEYWGIRANGFRNYMSRFFTTKGGPIGTFVGILEAVSEVAKVISFSFRLMGNMFAGEVLIFAFVFLLPIMAAVFVLPFMLETFVGFIQAVIFSALTLVFATLAVESHEEHPKGDNAH